MTAIGVYGKIITMRRRYRIANYGEQLRLLVDWKDSFGSWHTHLVRGFTPKNREIAEEAAAFLNSVSADEDDPICVGTFQNGQLPGLKALLHSTPFSLPAAPLYLLQDFAYLGGWLANNLTDDVRGKVGVTQPQLSFGKEVLQFQDWIKKFDKETQGRILAFTWRMPEFLEQTKLEGKKDNGDKEKQRELGRALGDAIKALSRPTFVGSSVERSSDRSTDFSVEIEGSVSETTFCRQSRISARRSGSLWQTLW